MTNIPFNVNEEGPASLAVYDLSGNRVAILLDARLKPGEYKAELYGAKLSPGVYFCRLVTNSSACQRKILVVR